MSWRATKNPHNLREHTNWDSNRLHFVQHVESFEDWRAMLGTVRPFRDFWLHRKGASLEGTGIDGLEKVACPNLMEWAFRQPDGKISDCQKCYREGIEGCPFPLD